MNINISDNKIEDLDKAIARGVNALNDIAFAFGLWMADGNVNPKWIEWRDTNRLSDGECCEELKKSIELLMELHNKLVEK